MKKLILYMMVVIFLFLSCQKSVLRDCCNTISQNCYIFFEKDGKSFINKENEDKIRLFVVDNNMEKELFNQGPKVGGGFNIIKRDSDNAPIFLLFGDDGKSPKKDSKSYIIDFGDGSRDTIMLSFKISENSLICTSVRDKDKILWDVNSQPIPGMPWERSFIISKK